MQGIQITIDPVDSSAYNFSAFEPFSQQDRKAWDLSTYLYGHLGHNFSFDSSLSVLRWAHRLSVHARICRSSLLCKILFVFRFK